MNERRTEHSGGYYHRIGLEDRRPEEGRSRGNCEEGPDHGGTRTLTSNRDLGRGSANHRNPSFQDIQSVDDIFDGQVGLSIGGHEA